LAPATRLPVNLLFLLLGRVHLSLRAADVARSAACGI